MHKLCTASQNDHMGITALHGLDMNLTGLRLGMLPLQHALELDKLSRHVANGIQILSVTLS